VRGGDPDTVLSTIALATSLRESGLMSVRNPPGTSDRSSGFLWRNLQHTLTSTVKIIMEITLNC